MIVPANTALVSLDAVGTLSTLGAGRKSRWERQATSKPRSRFGPPDQKTYLPPPFIDLPAGLTPLQVDQFLREQRLNELSRKLERGELEFEDPDIRAPSPPPQYDRLGNRTNTREVRVRTAMLAEHQRLLEYAVRTVPGFVPPQDFKPQKKVRKIIIPQDKYPEYNFMGLIIGPRGCNHKRLELESGSQISIRGRGTQKEGKKTDHQSEEEATMPQHVHIAADTDDQIDKAVALIEPLLDPHHPAHEEYKKKGLEQLALVNGVSLDKLATRCSICGATGHINFNCPEAEFQSFKKAEVQCALCGDKGHVTMDCKLARGLSSEELATIEKAAQGITRGGPLHFGGRGGQTPFNSTIPGGLNPVHQHDPAKAPMLSFDAVPPPPPPAFSDQTMDKEYSHLMAEIAQVGPGATKTEGPGTESSTRTNDEENGTTPTGDGQMPGDGSMIPGGSLSHPFHSQGHFQKQENYFAGQQYNPTGGVPPGGVVAVGGGYNRRGGGRFHHNNHHQQPLGFDENGYQHPNFRAGIGSGGRGGGFHRGRGGFQKNFHDARNFGGYNDRGFTGDRNFSAVGYPPDTNNPNNVYMYGPSFGVTSPTGMPFDWQFATGAMAAPGFAGGTQPPNAFGYENVAGGFVPDGFSSFAHQGSGVPQPASVVPLPSEPEIPRPAEPPSAAPPPLPSDPAPLPPSDPAPLPPSDPAPLPPPSEQPPPLP